VKLFSERLGQTTQLSVITKTQSTFAQFPVAITSFTTSSSHGLPDVNGIDQRAVVDHAVKQFIDVDCSLENITIARILSNGNESWNESMPGVTVNSSQVEYDFIARGSPPYAITVVLRGQDGYEQSYVAPNPIAANETLSFPDVTNTTRSVSNASLGTTMTLTTNFNKTLQDVDISNISITSQNDAQIEIGIINGSTMQYSMAVNEIEAYSGTYTMSYGNVQRSYIWFCNPVQTGIVYTLPNKVETETIVTAGFMTDIVCSLQGTEVLPSSYTVVATITQGSQSITPSLSRVGNVITLKDVLLNSNEKALVVLTISTGPLSHQTDSLELSFA
jgi:hypothetical protein